MDNASKIILNAVITATGPDSEVPNRADAVDANIYVSCDHVGCDHVGCDYVGYDYVCAVTLLNGESGALETWGCEENWCSDPDALEGLGDRDQVVEEIERAVRVAATAQEHELSVVESHGNLVVKCNLGGVWAPSEETQAAISASPDPETAVLRACVEDPMSGEWHS